MDMNVYCIPASIRVQTFILQKIISTWICAILGPYSLLLQVNMNSQIDNGSESRVENPALINFINYKRHRFADEDR